MNYQFLQLEQQDQVMTVWMDRAERHNAFNTEVIEELYHCFQFLHQHPDIRVVILASRGKNFSAGADLNWMKQAGAASVQENQADAFKLAQMLHCLASLKQPTIARVQGIAFGGGMGLAAACDICVATDDAQFATSEVRLGLAPSTISPYVIRAIGARQASRYFLTAERISAQHAKNIGLVHEVTTIEQLDSTIAQLVDSLLLGAPLAQSASKQLIQMVSQHELNIQLLQFTAQHIADIRQGDEAKQGLNAFLNKQTPAWIKTTAE
ncbi:MULTISPECIES: enoyl-CoA hydratase/isomerase family protein [unclassified Acinetobacter]|uniref:enoyl-CoA hydratase/isomerase family protein n=1 Tax=unclassified Acinetobacter TaxID=196816 RepID=UPI002934CD86|nr:MULTISPECIES: enoyl-CoA hydratase/isomerase family protein [unclassified Acinetobacter]WOE33334.1 enoyl-CoA hydratase/isomerase family protein [Acinetobacter sp. SAAs470]WOE37007.1 enoyl-CoA hydratase/isomerase family protein [Acinetobacter sp. SAAs474]